MFNVIKNGIQNTSYLFLGNLFSQLFSLFGFLYVANILGPEKFGVYSTTLAFIALFFVFTLPGLDRVILINGSRNLDNLGYLVKEYSFLKFKFIVFSIVCSVILAFFMPYESDIRFLIIIFSFSIIFSSFTGYFSSALQAHEKMKEVSFLRILNSFFVSLFSILVLLLGYDLVYLVCSIIFSYMIITFLHYYEYNKIKVESLESRPLDSIKPAFTYSLISFLSIIIIRSDIIFISMVSDQTQVGIYAVPMALMAKSLIIRNTFVAGFSPVVIKSVENSGYNFFDYLKLSLFILFIFTIIFMIFSQVSDNIINLLLGDAYMGSSVILQVLVFSLIFSFSTLPFTQLLQALGHEKILLWSLMISVILKIPGLFIFYHFYDLLGVAYTTVLVSVVVYFYLFISCLKLKPEGNLETA